MMAKLVYGNRRGVTLLELIIVVALIAIVLATAYRVHFHGIKIFDRGTKQSHTQQNVRIVDEYLLNNLRNAEKIFIEEENPGDYSFFEIKDKKLYHDDKVVTSTNIEDMEVKITKVNPNGLILSYTVTSQDGSQKFIYTNQFLLNNVKSDYGEEYEDYRSIKDGLRIFYKTNES